ncbi:MAG: lysine biosynthesis protein LysW [Ardenticatenaceae bacterium]|nr:lysine biosynthesis protein LysW [Ardenticatenaceae bacterium]HBY92462.1 lysine biosynthesis protein LysW [Chloroflexota bacterium]
MQTASCPECEAEISFPDDVMLNEITQCPDCGAELEVVNLDPLEVELAPEVEEDWGE